MMMVIQLQENRKRTDTERAAAGVRVVVLSTMATYKVLILMEVPFIPMLTTLKMF